MASDPLFTPFAHKSLSLRNRIVMAPMTRSFSPGGTPTAEVAAYYGRRAAAEVGLIISEGTAVERPAAANDPAVPHFHGEAALAGWSRVVEAVNAEHGVIVPQLWHVGAIPGSEPDWRPFGPIDSPSGLSEPSKRVGEPMSEEDIADCIIAFASAAGAAQNLGFGGLELHGAHGYLIDQFFWSGANQRADRFGGPGIVERNRFALELVKSIRSAVGEGFALILRVSQWKIADYTTKIAQTPAELEAWLVPLAEAGVDIFHCSQRRFWEPEFEGSNLNLAGWTKALTGKSTISVGSIGLTGDVMAAFQGETSRPASLDELRRRLERGEFDLAAVGRALLADPAWAAKVRAGREAELEDFRPEALTTLS